MWKVVNGVVRLWAAGLTLFHQGKSNGFFFLCICREHCLLGSESLLLYVGKEETK